jgi:cholest-4-en-3-one 26-monooxygenase
VTEPAERPGLELARRLTDPEIYLGDPHPTYALLRSTAPVAWNDVRGFWALSRHRDICAVESDAATFCAGRGILTDEIGLDYASPPTMMHSDPPAHTRYRRLVQPGFRPSVVRTLEPALRARAASLVDAMPSEEPVDVMTALAIPFPLQVIGDILGLPEDDWGRAYEWSEAVIPGARPDWSDERRAGLMAEMVDHLVGTSKRRRSEPRADMLTALAEAVIDGDRLSDDELAMFLVQLLVAGNETTRNLIGGGLVALGDHPDQWERLRAERTLVPTAVEELLRWTTPVISFMRTATRDAEIAGVRIAAGEPVLMLFASADRDEEVFGPSAGTLDVARTPNPHLAFGMGNHFCLGAALARLEARAVIEAMLVRFAALEPAGSVERSPSAVIAGLRRAPLRFSAA